MSYDPTAAGITADDDTTVDDTTVDEPPTLPADRHTGCPFDPPAELTALSDKPLRRMRYADGHIGWLVTGHAAARAILADPRFSSRYELLHPPLPMEGVSGELPPAPVGDILGLDAPEHTRYRRLLTGKFTVRRMRQLTERVEQFTTECLDPWIRPGPRSTWCRRLRSPCPRS